MKVTLPEGSTSRFRKGREDCSKGKTLFLPPGVPSEGLVTVSHSAVYSMEMMTFWEHAVGILGIIKS